MIFVFICAATLPASFVLLRDGFFSSSDGMIHLYRVFELDRALHAGIFFPRWLPLSGYGYGLPVFNYYPPLAYYLAEFFHLLGAGYIGSIKLLIAFGFILAALSMFLFARDLLGAHAAFVASIAFVYLPYLLSDAYIRGNFPEMLAMALIPLALYAFRRVFAAPDLKNIIFAALAFAAIILTHHLTAMLAAPLIGAYIIFLFAMQRDWKKLPACIGAISLSLILSAFYWVPALTELNLVFVGPASLARFLVSRLVSIENFFAPSLAYNYLPQSDALLHSAGFPQTVAALAVGFVALSQVASRRSQVSVITFYVLFFTLLLIASIFMMLNLSAPLWYAIPTLRFMQFPWRFQILAGISIAFLIGVAARQLLITNYRNLSISQHLHRIAFGAVQVSLISLSLIFLSLFNLPDRSFALTDSQVNLLRSDDPDYVAAQMGWSWTREFVPATVLDENVQGAIMRRAAPETPRANPAVRIENDSLLSRTTRVIATEPTEISLHQFYFPGWQTYIDGAPVRTYPNGSLGIVTVTAPAGNHRVEFRFEDTPYRAAMDVVSALGFIVIAACIIRGHMSFRGRPEGATEKPLHRPQGQVSRLQFGGMRFLAPLGLEMTIVAAIIFLGAIVWLHTRTASAAQPIALSADLGHNALLVGYSTERESDALYVTLDWFALREMQDDFVVTVQLLDANGKIIAQSDSLTDWGVTPTTRWQRGEMVTDRRVLRNIPRGTYRLITGMYLPREGGIENLAGFDRDGKQIGDQVEMGMVEVGN